MLCSSRKKETKACKADVYLWPKEIDGDVAKLHLPAFGETLIVFQFGHGAPESSMRQSSIDVVSSAKVKTCVFPDSSTFTSLQERSPARLGEVLTVLAQSHAGVYCCLG